MMRRHGDSQHWTSSNTRIVGYSHGATESDMTERLSLRGRTHTHTHTEDNI